LSIFFIQHFNFSRSSLTLIDPNNSNELNRHFWESIKDEFIDNIDEELLMTMLEREQQSESSTRPKRKKKNY
jgi:hypothetical protein